jgi:hypothetical protein
MSHIFKKKLAKSFIQIFLVVHYVKMHDRELRIKKVESLSVLKNVTSYGLSILEYQVRFTQNS